MVYFFKKKLNKHSNILSHTHG